MGAYREPYSGHADDVYIASRCWRRSSEDFHLSLVAEHASNQAGSLPPGARAGDPYRRIPLDGTILLLTSIAAVERRGWSGMSPFYILVPRTRGTLSYRSSPSDMCQHTKHPGTCRPWGSLCQSIIGTILKCDLRNFNYHHFFWCVSTQKIWVCSHVFLCKSIIGTIP